jgi:hypothetical protein
MAKEEVEIEVRLSATYWDEPPLMELWIDDIKFADDFVKAKKELNELDSFQWKGELEESEHTFKLVLKGKNIIGSRQIQTVKDEKGNIIKDQLLHLENILLDNIELGHTAIKLSEYHQFNYDGYTHEPVVKNKNTFGVNGEMILKFSIPTYIWLLENI